MRAVVATSPSSARATDATSPRRDAAPGWGAGGGSPPASSRGDGRRTRTRGGTAPSWRARHRRALLARPGADLGRNAPFEPPDAPSHLVGGSVEDALRGRPP